MADRKIEIGTMDYVPPVEYQKFTEWYKSFYGGNPPKNNAALVNSEIYKYWKQTIRPMFWTPKMESEATAKRYGELSPEEESRFKQWYQGVYGSPPPEAAMKPGSIWQTAFRDIATPTSPFAGTPPEGEDDALVKRLAQLDIEKFEWQKQQESQLSPWQKQQLQQQSWERLNKLDEARWLAQGQAAQLENTRLMNRYRPSGMTFEQEQANQSTLAKEFEQMRGMFANSPRKWIQESLPNPYQPREMTADEQLYKSQANQEQANAILKQAQQLEKMASSDPKIALTPEQINSIDIAKQNWSDVTDRNIRLNVARQAGMQGKSVEDTGIGEAEQIEAGKWATPRPAAGGEGFEVGQPSNEPDRTLMPKIPDWLAQVTGVSGRVPKQGTRVNILTPSGQSWNVLSPSQQEMWGGFVDWAGNRPETDILDLTQKMIPQAPSLGRTWRPVTQRV